MIENYYIFFVKTPTTFAVIISFDEVAPPAERNYTTRFCV